MCRELWILRRRNHQFTPVVKLTQSNYYWPWIISLILGNYLANVYIDYKEACVKYCGWIKSNSSSRKKNFKYSTVAAKFLRSSFKCKILGWLESSFGFFHNPIPSLVLFRIEDVLMPFPFRPWDWGCPGWGAGMQDDLRNAYDHLGSSP